LNALVGRKKLARISSTPGRTQLINFFEVDARWVFIDLPGYGYAKVPERIRAQWAPMIEECLSNYGNLRLVVVILDSRHEVSALDQLMIEWLDSYEIPRQIVATKVDKLAVNLRKQSLDRMKHTLGLDKVISFSAVTGEGKQELWRLIESV
jgi:GTP-binding protein